MWRFLNNVEPPKKRSKTEVEKRVVRQEYDQIKRQRSFQDAWLHNPDFKPWLRYEKESKLMFCSVCENWADVTSKGVGKTEFVKGCTSLRIESLHKHFKSEVHSKAAAAKRASEAPPGTSEADRCLKQLNKAAYDRLQILFRTCHSLAKHGRPFSDFVWQTDLDEAKGLDVGKTYRNEVQCREFTDAIAEIERQNLEKEVKDSKFLSIMCDEATDAAVVEQLILFIRYAVDGKVSTRFLAIQKLDRATAANCYDEILAALHEQCNVTEPEIWEKLVGFASDGASVMTGKRSGVGARLKEHQPKLQTIHCIAHRLELAIKDAAKLTAMFGKMNQFLANIYLFYHNSTLNRGLLRRTAEALGIKRFIPTRTGGTRWVAHTLNALTNLFAGYPAIVQHLLEIKDQANTSTDSKGKSAGFLKLLLSRQFLEFLNSMVDVTSVLSQLSHSFQKTEISISEIPKLVKDTVHSLDKLKSQHGHDGPALRRFKVASCDGSFHGHKLDGEPVDGKLCEDVVSNIINAIDLRFDINSNPVQEASARVINFKAWPTETEDDFGDAEIAQLVDFFGSILQSAGANPNLVEMEWSSVKDSVYKDFKPVHSASWEKLAIKYKTSAPNLFCMVDLVLTLPAHSVECERGFSQMKRVKNDWRNNLGNAALTSTLRIVLEGQTESEFDPIPAIDYWNGAARKGRRPFQPPYGQRKSREEPEESEGEEDQRF